MQTTLARFQDAFARALIAPDAAALTAPEVAPIVRQPGFAVYRNTVMKGCIDALQANYPAVSRLVGDEWFRAAAALYARECLPQQPMLMAYGETFPDFLAAFEPARELPYLAGVAQLDRSRTEAHIAPQEAPLSGAVLARCDPEALARLTLRPHAAARWHWFEAQPIATLWRRNRAPIACGEMRDLDWHDEGLLITRPADAVRHVELDRAGCVFLDACAAGLPLAEAATASLALDSDTDLAGMMASLLTAGAFGSVSVSDSHEEQS